MIILKLLFIGLLSLNISVYSMQLPSEKNATELFNIIMIQGRDSVTKLEKWELINDEFDQDTITYKHTQIGQDQIATEVEIYTYNNKVHTLLTHEDDIIFTRENPHLALKKNRNLIHEEKHEPKGHIHEDKEDRAKKETLRLESIVRQKHINENYKGRFF